MAGGYAGHNEGGHIWGINTKKWKGQDYTGPTSTCKAVRIRSVFGEEIAGGFTGLNGIGQIQQKRGACLY